MKAYMALLSEARACRHCAEHLPFGPRPECAPLWRDRAALTECVRAWRAFAPNVIPLPPPSPRNDG